MAWLAVVGALALFVVFCVCLVRAGRHEDRLRERLVRRAQLAPERIEETTLEDLDGETETDPAGEVRVKYHWNLFI